jgi:hypothetical protein
VTWLGRNPAVTQIDIGLVTARSCGLRRRGSAGYGGARRHRARGGEVLRVAAARSACYGGTSILLHLIAFVPPQPTCVRHPRSAKSAGTWEPIASAGCVKGTACHRNARPFVELIPSFLLLIWDAYRKYCWRQSNGTSPTQRSPKTTCKRLHDIYCPTCSLT